jgi:hypothetical protein
MDNLNKIVTGNIRKSKLISLLKCLNKREIERFALYLKTPVFNERETVYNLFREFIKYYPEFDHNDFTKENLFAKLYGEKPYNDDLMRNMISRLNKLLEQYLAFISYEKDTFSQKYRLLEELSQRGQGKLFMQNLKDIERLSEQAEVIDLHIFQQRYFLSYLSLNHFFSFPHQHDVDKRMLEIRESKLLDLFLSDAVNIYSMMYHDYMLHSEKKYEPRFIKPILEYIEKNPSILENNFYLNINYNILRLLSTQNNKNYLTSKNLLNKYSVRLTNSEKSKNYTALLNYLQSRIFDGDTKMLRVKYELYKEAFANNGLYNNKYIKYADLILAINNSLMLKEFSQAEELVLRYSDEVDPFYRKSTRHYCLGLICYYKTDFANALNHLIYVDYENSAFKYIVRTLKLMIFFSMNDPEGFYSLVDSFRHFLNKNKSEAYNYRVTMGFINFINRLFKGMETPANFDINSFKTDLRNAKHIARKQWLVQVTEEMELKQIRS